MAEKHEKGIKRYGVRYGRTTKKKLGHIEAQQKKAHTCPYCRYPKVSRKSAGIWHCGKCKSTFTSRAYNVTKPGAVKTEQSLEV